EIGGEVRCRGLNQKDQVWRIGIQDPRSPSYDAQMAIVQMKDRSLATSGNYRNFYEKEGKIFAHIVDPRTGYTAYHNLLSTSVFAPDCMTADAYATAFMVLGLEQSIKIVEADPNLEAVFIFQTDDELDIYESTGISEYLQVLKEQ
ncbi:MAG: FAD:protein FMN transferase, partial [Cyclobacteriaceae bacterium]